MCRSRVSPQVVTALLAIEDQRFYEHHGFDLIRIVSAGLGKPAPWPRGAGRQHHHPTAGASELSHARQDHPPEAAGADSRGANRARVFEGRDSPSLPEQGVFRRRPLRRRSGGAGLLRQACLGAESPEAALLAGLVKSPSSYAPTVSLERATARRNLVLQVMLDSGVIDKPTWESARASEGRADRRAQRR